MRVLSMRPRTAAADGDPMTAVSSALRQARASAGVDLVQAAQRVDTALGCTIINGALFDLWERGLAMPTALQFLVAVRALAGSEAAAILSSLAN